MTHTSESGRSMVEMLAVVSIISVISIGGISGISFGMKLFRSNATQEMIEGVAQNVSVLYSWDRELPKATGGMCSRICRNKSWDTVCTKDCNTAGTQATYENPFGGELIVKEGSTGDSYTIEVTQLPTDVCTRFATTKWVNVSNATCSSDKTTLTVTAH